MVMKSRSSPANPDPNPNPTDLKFKGVRKRKWGKWVSEIRLPHSRDRIWLGSYDCPIKAARAFDAAQICLRGPSSANLNFPNNPPKLDGPTNGLSPAEIQLASATYANSEVSDSTQYSDMSSTATVEEEVVSDSCEGGPSPVLDYCDYETLRILGSGNFDESFGFGDFWGPQYLDCCEYDSLYGSGFGDLSLWNF